MLTGELVFATTSDHLRLHGFYSKSEQALRTSARLGYAGVAVLLHGLGGNFYASRLLNHQAQNLLALGLDVLLVNTRGHDMVNTASWGGRAQSVGAAFERVGDCVMDIHGWLDWVGRRDSKKVLLVGHSLGAIKSLYAMSRKPHPAVSGVVALSATRLSHQRMIQSARGEVFRETLKRCEARVAQGQGGELMHVPFPFPTWMTASGYLEKYGPEETYNWLTFIDQVELPTLLVFGERELDENPAFEGLREELTQLDRRFGLREVVEIPGADHFYASRLESLNQTVADWVTQ